MPRRESATPTSPIDIIDQAHQLLGRDPQLVAERTQVFFDQFAAKAIVAGGHGSMGREGRLRSDLLKRIVETQTLAVHPLANCFQRGKR